MKISLNWIKQYTEVAVTADELVQKIGMQLGAVEGEVRTAEKYTAIIIVRIVECIAHPNADKLQICTIDDGGNTPDVNRDENGYVQVVCGGVNARADLVTVWIPPGATVPSSYGKDPFVLSARELRGEISYGMLATAKELALSDDDDGIIELNETSVNSSPVQAGMLFSECFGLDDVIVDVENKMFTHRPDCFGQVGVAREIAGITGNKFVSPQWYLNPAKDKIALPGEDLGLPLKITNEATNLSPRVMAVAINKIQISSSPVWLQAALTKIGVKPINNIVDLTNYMMHLTAQPMHAFDYNKIKSLSEGVPSIGPRMARQGEEIELLGAKKIRLNEDDIVLSTDRQAVDLAGIMGGANSEIDDNTKAIILTCCAFDMYTVRRSSMRHGIFNEAATRNTKGQPASQIEPVVLKAIEMILELCPGSSVASELFDLKGEDNSNPKIESSAKFINARLGLSLESVDIKKILENVEFSVAVSDDNLVVQAPFWRTDIEIAEDVVEEVGRLYGYDKLPLILPRHSILPAPKDAKLYMKQSIRSTLSAAGANEVLTYSFVHGNLLNNAGQETDHSYRLSNALSPDLQYYRQTLMPSLLHKVHPNIKAGHEEFALFELGKTHNKIHGLDEENVPGEISMAALVFASKNPKDGAAYFHARRYVDHLLGKFGFTIEYAVVSEDPGYPVTRPYDLKRSAYATIVETKTFLGMVGEFRPEVVRAFKLPVYSAGFEISPEAISEALAAGKTAAYKPLSRYPAVQQDITLQLPDDHNYYEVWQFVNNNVGELKPPDTTIELTPVSIYQKQAGSSNYTFRLSIVSTERTLQDKLVNGLLDKVASLANKALGATRV